MSILTPVAPPPEAEVTHPSARPEPGRHPLAATISPNLFASVMGTGIVAVAAVSIPIPMGSAILAALATAVWILAAVLLLVLGGLFTMKWCRYPERARGHARHPVMCHFYGAVPMAILTVGTATLLVGPGVLGSWAVWVDAALWLLGTAMGVGTSIWIPYRLMTRKVDDAGAPTPVWLMPVVPPMVSASAGALLVPYLPQGQWRLALLCCGYLLFGMSLVVGMIVMTMILARVLHGELPAGPAAPTIWITLGLIGQSITAAGLLGAASGAVFTDTQHGVAMGLAVFGVAYGLAMGGFGIAMFILAGAVTVRAIRAGMPFAPTWWSFTFPIGTCVTGTAVLGKSLGSVPIEAVSVVLFGLLLSAWSVVAARSALQLARHLRRRPAKCAAEAAPRV